MKWPSRKLLFLINAFSLLLILSELLFFVVVPNYGKIVTVLKPQPERFTELYFEDHNKLPTTVLPEVPVTLRFTIHNVEDMSMDYKVEAFAESESTISAQIKQPLYNNDLKLASNESSTVPLQVQLPSNFPAGRTKITVSINQNQTIHFYTTLDIPPVLTPTVSNSL